MISVYQEMEEQEEIEYGISLDSVEKEFASFSFTPSFIKNNFINKVFLLKHGIIKI